MKEMKKICAIFGQVYLVEKKIIKQQSSFYVNEWYLIAFFLHQYA